MVTTVAFALLVATAGHAPAADTTVRVATFNIRELDAAKAAAGDPKEPGTDPQLRAAAEILQRTRPDILLINEIDSNDGGRTARLFQERYLAVSQAGQAPIEWAHRFLPDVNTGVPSGLDLDRDGASDGPADAWGFGRYPGQYGMVVLSRFPIDETRVRTFRELRWATMPGPLLPDGQEGRPDWFPGKIAAQLRLSSKTHCDVPIRIGDSVLHLLASHPTPPVFDGPEDRNGRRNHDEIRLWADYLDDADYLMDDAGTAGGLLPGASFVILGDLNTDPHRPGPTGEPAIRQLLDHPRVKDPRPRSAGSAAWTRSLPGDKTLWTSDWGRIDYVLPSADLHIVASGIFLPPTDDPTHRTALTASDHCLVWLDITLPPTP